MSKPAQLVLCLVALSQLSCGGGYHRLYSGPERSRAEIAIVRGGTPLRLHQIDGQEGANYGGVTRASVYNSNLDGTFELHLLPGKYDLIVSYRDAEKAESVVEDRPMSIEVEAGKEYLLTARRLGGMKWAPVFGPTREQREADRRRRQAEYNARQADREPAR